jgi:transcriptional regulator with XRE-family HTH domain
VIHQRHRYRPSAAERLRTMLADEFARRRKLNPRYSLRAFARSMHLEHSTLSQLLRGKRPLTWKAIRNLASTARWTGAGILKLSSQPNFRFDSRTVARELRVSVDEVNIALADLCLFGLIELKGDNT